MSVYQAFRYRPELDGLRAVAVLLVLFFHVGAGFEGGYIGVDVFFVISGFLITAIILKGQSTNSFKLGKFWERRIRRIFPASVLVSAVSLVVGILCLLPHDLEDLGKSVIAQQLMVSNIYFWRTTNYFGGTAEFKPLLHTWSLAVEEQFYLGYPFFLVLVRRSSDKLKLLFLSLAAIVSFVISVYGVRYYPSAAFYLLPTRAWELLLGAMITLVAPPRRWPKWALEVMSAFGVSVILAVSVWYGADTPFPGVNAVLPCLGASVFIFANSAHSTYAGKLLSQRWLVFIGLISYSLYLWHWPILAFVRYWGGLDLSVSTQFAVLLASFVAAWISWKFVETPFRTGRKNVSFRRSVSIGLGTSVLLVMVSFGVVLSYGFPQRFPLAIRKYLGGSQMVHHRFQSSTSRVLEGDVVRLGKTSADHGRPDFLVWGDSHAMVLGDMLDRLSELHCIRGEMAARSLAVPLLHSWAKSNSPSADIEWNDAVLGHVRNTKPRCVFLVARWAAYTEGIAEFPSYRRDDSLLMRSTASKQSAQTSFREALEETINALDLSDTKIWIVKQVPFQVSDPRKNVVVSLATTGKLPKGVGLEEHALRQKFVNSVIDEVAASHSNVGSLDPMSFCFDKSGSSLVCSEEGLFYSDEDHLSQLGAERLLGGMFEQILESIQPRSLCR